MIHMLKEFEVVFGCLIALTGIDEFTGAFLEQDIGQVNR